MSIEDIVATGELFTQQQGRQNWHLRKCVLSGIYLSYFDRTGDKRGQWDITDCVVRKISPEECKMPAAIHAFALICSKKYILLCASTESNRIAWMNILNEQIAEYKDPIRRFLQYGEVMYGHDQVKRRNMLGMYSCYKLVLTNYPRILVFEPASIVLKEQHSWSIDTPPLFTKLSETKFKISIRNKKNLSTKDLYFGDAEKGCTYWENVFKRFPDMKYYSHTKVRPSVCIDFADTASDKNIAAAVSLNPGSSSKKGTTSNTSDMTASSVNNNASKSQAQQAAMAMAMMHHNKKTTGGTGGDGHYNGENDSQSTCSDRTDAVNREANKMKLRSLLHALKSIDNLLAHINDEIYNLDLLSLADSDHTNTSASGGNNSRVTAEETEAIEEHRQNKRVQLQVLKDNVTVLSANLKTIISNHNNNVEEKGTNRNSSRINIPASTSAQDLVLVKAVGSNDGGLSSTDDIDLRNIEIVIAETSKVLKVLHSSEQNQGTGNNNNTSGGNLSARSAAKVGSDRGSAGTAGSTKSAAADDGSSAKDNYEWVRVEEHHLHPHQESSSNSTSNSSKSNTNLNGMTSHHSTTSVDSGHGSASSAGAAAATAAVIAASTHTMSSHDSSHLLCALTANSSTAAIAAVAAAQLEFENIHITAKDSVAVDTKTKNRPPHWDKVKLKRVLIKEFVLELQNYLHHTSTINNTANNSSSKSNLNEQDDTISQNSNYSHVLRSRKELLDLEERIMTKEVNEHGRLLNMPVLRKTSLEKAAIAITTDNFDEETLDRRPLAWQAVKLRRVMIKEAGIRQLGKTSEFQIQKDRKKMLIKEEELMMAEVAKTGEVTLTALEPLPLVLQASISPAGSGTTAATGTTRLTGATVSGQGSDMSGVTTDSNGSGSGSATGRTDMSGGSGVSLDMKELCISESNFDITTGKRPKGWSRIKHRRMSLREWQERSHGVKEDIIISSRSALEKEVEEEMIKEASVCSRVTAIERRLQSNKHTGGAQPLFPKGTYTGHTAMTGMRGTSERGRDGRIRTDTSNTNVTSNNNSQSSSHNNSQNLLSLGSSSTSTSTANSLYELSLIHTVNQALGSLSEQVSESLSKTHQQHDTSLSLSDTHSSSVTPTVITADNRGDETPPSVLKQQQLLQQEKQVQQQQQNAVVVPMSSVSHQQQKESLQQQLEHAQLKERALLQQSSSTTSSSSKLSTHSHTHSHSHSPLPLELQSPASPSSTSTSELNRNSSNKNYNQDQLLLAQQALLMSTPKATKSANNSAKNNSGSSSNTNPAVKLLQKNNNNNAIADESNSNNSAPINSARNDNSGIELSSDSHKSNHSTTSTGSHPPPFVPPPPPRISARGVGSATSGSGTPTTYLSPYTSPRSPVVILPVEDSFQNLTILQQKQQHDNNHSGKGTVAVGSDNDNTAPLKVSSAHHQLHNGRHDITGTIDSDDDVVEEEPIDVNTDEDDHKISPPQKPPRRSLTPTSANYITDNMDFITTTDNDNTDGSVVPPAKPPRSRRNSLEPYL